MRDGRQVRWRLRSRGGAWSKRSIRSHWRGKGRFEQFERLVSLAAAAGIVVVVAFSAALLIQARRPATHVLSVPQPPVALVPLTLRSASAQLLDGPCRVIVEDRGAGETASRRLLEVAVRSLPIVERVSGIPYAGARPLRIVAHGGREATANYEGYFDGREIHVAREAMAGTLIHELAHVWFHGNFADYESSENRWITEGLAEYTTVQVFRADPVLGDPVFAHRTRIDEFLQGSAGEHAGPLAGWAPPFPLNGGEEVESKRREWYGRAYAFFHLISNVAGESTFRETNASIAAWGIPVETRTYLDALARLVPALLDCGAGWVLPGERRPAFSADLLLDHDGDGLSQVEELALGSSPFSADSDADGVADGQELFVCRTDPTNADSRPADAPRQADATLAGFATPRMPLGFLWRDANGDLEPGAPNACDLYGFRVDLDEHYLYLTYHVRREPSDCEVVYNLGIDADDDDVFDWVIGFGQQGEPWLGRIFEDWTETDWQVCSSGMTAAEGDTIEMAIPRIALDLPESVRIYPFSTWLPGPAQAFEYGDHMLWLDLELSNLPR